MASSPVPLSQVIGNNVRRLRGLKPMDSIAREARNIGLNWATSRVSAIEDGRFKPTLDTLAVLAIAVGRATSGRPLPLTALLDSDQMIQISDTVSVSADSLKAWATGDSPLRLDPGPGITFDQFHDAVHSQLDNMRRFTEAERRAANDLSLSPRQLIEASHRLWGHSFISERDNRADVGTSPQKLGRITRDLKEEIRAEVADGDD